MKLRLKVTKVSSRLQNIFAGGAICTSFLELVSGKKRVGKPQTTLCGYESCVWAQQL